MHTHICILTHTHKHIHTLLVSVAPTKKTMERPQGRVAGKEYKKRKTQFTGVHSAAQNINPHPSLVLVAPSFPFLSYPFLSFPFFPSTLLSTPLKGAAAEGSLDGSLQTLKTFSETIKHLSVFTVFVMVVAHTYLMTVCSAGY